MWWNRDGIGIEKTVFRSYLWNCGCSDIYTWHQNILHTFVCCNNLQVTDYAIARRIVDLHCHLEESVNRVYSAEDIQRYITFARQFKPRVSLLLTVENECACVEYFWNRSHEYRMITRVFSCGSADKSWLYKLHSGRVQAFETTRSNRCCKVGVAYYCTAAWEHDSFVWRHRPHVLPRRGFSCFLNYFTLKWD